MTDFKNFVTAGSPESQKAAGGIAKRFISATQPPQTFRNVLNIIVVLFVYYYCDRFKL